LLASILKLTLMAGCHGQIATLDAPGFSKAVQTDAVLATVRVINQPKNLLGSGVILAKSGRVAYILSAGHLADDSEDLEVHLFSRTSYPKAVLIVRSVSVVARRRSNNQDLALLRLVGYSGESAGMEICPASSRPQVKSFVALAIGCGEANYPELSFETIEGSILAAKPGDPRPARFWCSSTRPKLGQSGAPLINAQGQLLGICSGAHGSQGLFCHIEDIQLFLREHGLLSQAGAK
jgi:S1-C subfamily serine protease